jgi:hypothetical protein
MKKLLAVVAAAGLTLAAAPAANAAGHTPDTDCMQAGIAKLKELEVFSAVAKDGLLVGTAVSVGVLPRDPEMEVDLEAVLPLSVVLADHRAGDDSLFLYPWCAPAE